MSKKKENKKEKKNNVRYYYTEFDIGLINDIRLWFHQDIKFENGNDIKTEYENNIIPKLISTNKDEMINKENGVLIFKTDDDMDGGLLSYKQKEENFDEPLYTYDEFMVILSQHYPGIGFRL